MINSALLDWKINNNELEKYEKSYMNGMNLRFCFHFRIDLSFFTKYEFLKVHTISAEDFISVIIYLNKMQSKYQKITNAIDINEWIEQINELRKSSLKNILIYNDLRQTKDGLIVPITDANNPYAYKNGAFQTLLLATSLWKKFYKLHKNKIDNLVYESYVENDK